MCCVCVVCVVCLCVRVVPVAHGDLGFRVCVWFVSGCVGAPLDFPPPLRRTHLPKSLSLFFLPPKIPTCFPSLGIFSLNYGGVVEGRALKYARLGSLDHLVNPLRLHSPGSTRWPCKRAVLRVWALQTPPKDPRQNRHRRTNQEFTVEERKTARNGGLPHRPPPPRKIQKKTKINKTTTTRIWHKIELTQVELGR